ncbi:PIN domain-like protein [Crepidotus variabilis]|uniref:PIN domain-like protein n=1 Tax=Crepidotus variabilis TaxID=179855 RepID=A0A9P6E653_9AGAR|nr:PIN domain-like protein [Crepidotus variabilis]
MGVGGLWKFLQNFGRRIVLRDFAVQRRAIAEQNGEHDSFLTLGVDMGTFMAECTGGALAAGVHRQPPGGGLYIFWKKLMDFLKAPIHLIFVFDGPGRPFVKRGRRVILAEPHWANAARDLIHDVGYESHEAPGEAETELAMLIRAGLIHGMISGDSDAAVHGAPLILRPGRIEADEYTLYDLALLSHDVDGLSLSQGGLILIALLCGGDYDPSGVFLCGPTIAYGLARCGFGDELLKAWNALNQFELNEFLTGWRQRLRAELETNSSGFLNRRHPSVAQDIDDEFPDLDVLQLYTSPLTSSSYSATLPTFRALGISPNIFALTQFCLHHFNWSYEELFRKFEGWVWEGIFIQLLYSVRSKLLGTLSFLMISIAPHCF